MHISRRLALAVALVVCGVIGGDGSLASGPSEAPRSEVGKARRSTFGIRPLVFEPNAGHLPEAVKFQARGDGYSLFLTDAAATWVWPDGAPMQSRSLTMRVVGGDQRAQVDGTEPGAARVQHFIGGDPNQWRTNIPTFGRVRYQAIYPGISLEYYGRDGSLEYDFLVNPGADPTRIALEFDGVDRVSLLSAGDVEIQAGGHRMVQRRPIAYQVVDGRRRPVEAAFVRRGPAQLAFSIGAYDRARPLVIDPVLSYSTFVGGTGGAYGDQAYGVTADPSGNVFVVGHTNSIVFPEGGTQTTNGSGEAFVMKFSPSGSLVYTALIGGSAIDSGEGIAVDAAGHVAITGWTDSTNFPTLNAIRPNQGGRDAFLAKLDAAGALVFSTYVGGSGGFEYGESVAFGADGSIYATGSTDSINFPVLNAYQPTRAGLKEAYVLKVSPSGALLYGTYLGGTDDENAESIAVDSAGNFVVTGMTESADFPTVDPFSLNRGSRDVYVTKFAADGASLLFSTYLGGDSGEYSKGIVVDEADRIYVTGTTDSNNFPLVSPIQTNRPGADGFLTRFSPLGVVDFSTYLGGNGADTVFGVAVVPGHVYLAGQTVSTDFPVLSPIQAAKAGPAGVADAFVTDISPSTLTIQFSTFLGGATTDQGRSVAVVEGRNVFVAGWTDSADFPTVLPIQDHKSATTGNVFLSRIAPYGVTDVNPRAGSTTGGDVVTITGQGFVSGSSVYFGGLAATNVNVTDATSITAVTPSHPAGLADVTVVGPGDDGSGTLYKGFAYRSGTAPVADAGADQQVEATGPAGGSVTLNGSASFDPDDLPLSYAWSIGSTVIGSGPIVTVTLPRGIHQVTLSVSNGTGSPGLDTVTISVVDTTAPVVTVVTPNGGNTLYSSTPTVLEWTAADAASPMSVFNVYLSTDGGTTFGAPICANVPASQSQCTWTPTPATTAGRIRVVGTDASGNVAADLSDTNFTINATGTPSVRVTAPNTLVNWGAGSTQNITWTHNLGAGAEMNLEVSVDGGSNWAPIAARVRNTSATVGSYLWTITSPLSLTARVRVTWNNGAVTDASDTDFTIEPAFITVAMPVAGTSWGFGTRQTQNWVTNLGPGDRVDVSFSTDGGGTFPLTIASNAVAGARTAAVTIPVLPAPTAAARTRIAWTNAPAGFAAEGIGSEDFLVEPAFVRVTTPNGGEVWTSGTNQTVTWAHNLGLESVAIDVSLDDGATYLSALASTPSDGAQAVPINSAWNSTQARVRVSWVASAAVADASDASFTIGGGALTLTSPNGGDAWTIGTSRTITWTSNLGGTENVRLELSLDGGATYPVVLIASTPSDGWQNVTVNQAWQTTQARVRISWVKQPTVADVSDASFNISPGFVTLTSPNGGEDLAAGGTHAVTWVDNLGAAEKVKLELSLDGGATYPIVLVASTPSDGIQNLTLNGAWLTAQARIRISWVKQPAIADTSNAVFGINPPWITLNAPNGGELWTVGSQQTITWTTNLGRGDNVKINLSKNNGGSYSLVLISSTPSDGAQTVTVASGWIAQQARIRIQWSKTSAVSDASNASFVIQ